MERNKIKQNRRYDNDLNIWLVFPGNQGGLCFSLLSKAAHSVREIEEDIVRPEDGMLSNPAVMLLKIRDSIIRAAAPVVLNFLLR